MSVLSEMRVAVRKIRGLLGHQPARGIPGADYYQRLHESAAYQTNNWLVADLPFLRWGCEKALHEVESALLGVLENLPDRFAAGLLRLAIFPLGARTRPPSDALSATVARAVARAIYEAEALPYPESLPSWRDKFPRRR